LSLDHRFPYGRSTWCWNMLRIRRNTMISCPGEGWICIQGSYVSVILIRPSMSLSIRSSICMGSLEWAKVKTIVWLPILVSWKEPNACLKTSEENCHDSTPCLTATMFTDTLFFSFLSGHDTT
jgi:hypothetical protein